MRSYVLALTLAVSGFVAAQSTLPGTFNSTATQDAQQTNSMSANGGYIVSPPTVSYGDGITPTVVTNQNTVSVTVPQNTSLNGPAVGQDNAASPVESNVPATAQASRNFDFVKAPNGESVPIAGSMADDSVSLGEIARKARNGKQISKRTITNADVNAMNGNPPANDGVPADSNATTGTSVAAPGSQQNGVNPAQSTGGAAGAAQPQSTQNPAYARPSDQGPFGAPATVPSDGTKPNAQQGPGISPRGTSPARKAPQPKNSDQQQLPRSSTSLPLLGTVGAIATLAGLSYIKLR